MKQFADLKSLSESLRQEAARKAKEKALREEQQRKAAAEANIFRNAMTDAIPIRADQRYIRQSAQPAPVPFQHLADEQAALMESLSDEFDAESLLETDESLSYRRPGVGPDVVAKLRKGHWVIQAQLDLHGMRRDEARNNLGDFLRKCCKQGVRCVRIIHGKGNGSVNKEPVLKQKVRSWLVQKEEVLAFSQATAADGGSGAVIVLLQA